MSTRKDKVSKQIQKDIAEIIRQHPTAIQKGRMLTVTKTRVTPDLGTARIYISVFPSGNSEEILNELNKHIGLYRNALGQKLRHQLKKVPEIQFFLDDSLDYIDNIDHLLNP
ncbi:MAG: 30S ribosome-binding factor RbfA [Bacteroidales bacterium]|nr:30S ribosome-binding factor RbfA [Bacteroidales bacterium]